MLERPHFYNLDLNQVGNASGVGNNLQKTLDSDAPFRLYGLAVMAESGVSLCQTQMRMSRPDRSWIQRNLVPITALNPFLQDVDGATGQEAGGAPPPFLFASPISPNLIYPPGGVVVFDFGDPAVLLEEQFRVVLVGTKIFRDGAVWAPTYPAKYRSLPFLDYALQVNPPAFGAQPLLNVPFNVQPDADFAWQAGQHTSGPIAAQFQTIGELANLLFVAKVPGAGGNSISVNLTGATGGANQPLSISVVGNAITVQWATNGIPFTTTTMAEALAALNGNPAVAALVSVFNTGALPILPVADTAGVTVFLAGGMNTGPAGGIGVRIKDWDGKYYMDDFTPVELLFGFAHAQVPGLLYPEIYIPKNQALYFDFSTLSTFPSAVAQLNLSLKGQKIYAA